MKAIIVIDMPKVCGECRASFCGDVWYCYAGEYRRPLFAENIQEKPSWCPLRPMPKKKLVLEHRIGNQIVNRYELTEAKGYNNCLDEILGETE